MKGIEKARIFFRDHGLPMLEEQFPQLLPSLAAGIAGRGSECFGFDDEISQDHDFRTGFALYLDDETERCHGFRLQRAYDALVRQVFPEKASSAESKLGAQEHGVIRISDFFRRRTGIPGAPRTWQEWLYTPEHAFAESVNGEVFMDHEGSFSRIRSVILYDMPEDVRLKKIASRLIFMAQSGQYNFMRCHKHGEPGAAAMAMNEFVRNAVSLIFILNFRFAPYYKWQFRALRELPFMGELAEPLENLLASPQTPAEKSAVTEEICTKILDHLRDLGLTCRPESYLEPHAFEVMKRIRSHHLRALHVMEG